MTKVGDAQIKHDVNHPNHYGSGAFPSGVSQNLGVPGNGGIITAPGDGYISLSASASPNGWIMLSSNGIYSVDRAWPHGGAVWCSIPVRAGAGVLVSYTDASPTLLTYIKSVGAA